MRRPARVVVTGGAGFLGSHLCDRLIGEGHEAVCLDNLLTGRVDNIGHLLQDPKFSFIQADVTKPIEVQGQVDAVLHLASPASPKDYGLYPIQTLKVGAIGTYHALGLAKANGAVFMLASSSEVYGNPQVNPQPEDYWGHVNPVGPRSVYDEAKRFAEAITVAYSRTHELDARIARVFNTYGPRMRADDGRAMPTFIRQALLDEDLTVFGDGLQTRSFCYVDDMVDGLFRLLMVDGSDGPMIVNLGNPEEVTILQAAREVVALTESSSKIRFTPPPDDDPKVRHPDITRARAILGWLPRVSRNEGIARTVTFIRDKLLPETRIVDKSSGIR